MNHQVLMSFRGLSLDVALASINHMKAINIRKQEKCNSDVERNILEEEFDMYHLEERIVYNQSKDLVLWKSIMHKIDQLYCPIIKAYFTEKSE